MTTGPVRDQLCRIAEHLAAAPTTAWWTRGVDLTEQWAVSRHGHDDGVDGAGGTADHNDLPPLGESLDQWRKGIRSGEEHHGEWWSVPPYPARVTTGVLADGVPAGLHFIEDGFGDPTMWTYRAGLPDAPRVLEITGPGVWARLCRDFPLDVTGQMQRQWGPTTGRDGSWVVPDFAELAHHYDAVHLTVLGYLATAGNAVDVGDGHAGLLAGWNPDETHWLVDGVRLDDAPVIWDRYPDLGWRRRGADREGPD